MRAPVRGAGKFLFAWGGSDLNVLAAIENSALGQYVLGNTLLFYSLLSVHAIGMAAVVGGSVMLSLRVLGFAVGVPVVGMEPLKKVAAWGFVANAGSGVLIYTSNATQLTVLWTFQLKMLSIVLGGLLLWILWRLIEPGKDDPVHVFGIKAKLAAGATIFFWTAAIVSGRYIAYTLPMGF